MLLCTLVYLPCLYLLVVRLFSFFYLYFLLSTFTSPPLALFSSPLSSSIFCMSYNIHIFRYSALPIWYLIDRFNIVKERVNTPLPVCVLRLRHRLRKDTELRFWLVW